MYDPDQNDFCVDCKVDTILIGEYYMVKPDVWQQTGLTTLGGMLCISCLEARIGRMLSSEDFSDVQLNKDLYVNRSSRLISRLFPTGL